MASDQHFADYVRDQMQGAGAVTSRKMFGEYAIYCDGKVVALVCDNQCFLRPTEEGRAFLGDVTEARPFADSKPHFLLVDELEDRQRLAELVRITAQLMPMPGTRKPKAKAPAKTATEARAKAPAKRAAKAPAKTPATFDRIAATLRREGGIDAPPETPRRGFGAGGLTVNGKIFAMLVNGALAVKLPAPRVKALVAEGRGSPFEAGVGRVMREWVAVPEDHERTWLALAREARDFVGGKS